MPANPCGCWLERGVISPAAASELLGSCPRVPGAGLREPFGVWAQAISVVEPARTIASGVLGAPARVTRAILFDKPPGCNWTLEVHQDTTVALAGKVENAPGFGPWSMKEGIWHAEAPEAVLRAMVTVRLHLDDADEQNGCLLVAPMGDGWTPSKLPRERLEQLRGVLQPVPAGAGDAVVMSPLTPHASGRNTTGRHRRVLHMEFAAQPPGDGLRWRDEAEVLGGPAPHSSFTS